MDKKNNMILDQIRTGDYVESAKIHQPSSINSFNDKNKMEVENIQHQSKNDTVISHTADEKQFRQG